MLCVLLIERLLHVKNMRQSRSPEYDPVLGFAIISIMQLHHARKVGVMVSGKYMLLLNRETFGDYIFAV
jgi:hypothetical protein